MFDNEQFYATPKELADKLVKLPKYHTDGMILEPSAGEGALVEALVHKVRGIDYPNIHCIEINPDRQAILKENHCIVVHDDFNTFAPLTPYSVIVMNPPFHEGARHLRKAIDICANGGEIACILNAETIRNPYTNERKALLQELEAQEEWRYEFIENAFIDADRHTKVEVALVYVRKKKKPVICSTFEHFKRWVFDERQMAGYDFDIDNSVVRYGEICQLLDRYQAEVRTAMRLYDEISAYNKVSLQDTNDYCRFDHVFNIKINRVRDYGVGDRANIVRTINYNYWKRLLFSKDLADLLTSDVQSAYMNNLYEMADFEFTERNILQLKQDLCRNLLVNIDAAIMKTFKKFTSEYAYNDYSSNIWYYNGWKTNKACRVNKKVIIPMWAFSSWDGSFESYKVAGELSDIEKCMSYLDCGRTQGYDMHQKLHIAQEHKQNRNIDTKFFTVTLYKKGTCHLVFKDEALLKKFNLYVGRKNRWLPDGYGSKPYEAMDTEEQAIVDSFEGKDSYSTDTFVNRDFYLTTPTNNVPLLTAGNIPA